MLRERINPHDVTADDDYDFSQALAAAAEVLSVAELAADSAQALWQLPEPHCVHEPSIAMTFGAHASAVVAVASALEALGFDYSDALLWFADHVHTLTSGAANLARVTGRLIASRSLPVALTTAAFSDTSRAVDHIGLMRGRGAQVMGSFCVSSRHDRLRLAARESDMWLYHARVFGFSPDARVAYVDDTLSGSDAPAMLATDALLAAMRGRWIIGLRRSDSD
jgi:hypothetical protein